MTALPPAAPSPDRPDSLSLAGQAAPIAAISVVGLSLSMSLPLFALMLEREGYTGAMIGASSMATPLAIILAAPAMPWVMARLGLARLSAGATLLAAAVFALIPEVEGIAAWTALRFVWGIATAGLFFTAEFWIVAGAPPRLRGRVIGLYGLAITAAFAAGPLLLLVTGDEGALPFRTAAVIAILALGPILYGARLAPDPSDDGVQAHPAAAFRYARSDPALLLAVVLFGAIEYGAISLFTAWGLRSGIEADMAITLVALFAVGSMVLQVPIGWAADRVEARRLLLACALACIAAPLVMVASQAVGPTVLAMLVWGGFGAGLYTVALAGLGARYAGRELAEASAAVTVAYGIGAFAAPGLFGLAMDQVAPPHGLMLCGAAAAALYAALVLRRLAVRARPAPPET
ncbi:MAG: MFS transporter [Pseudomonadota bacterium]